MYITTALRKQIVGFASLGFATALLCLGTTCPDDQQDNQPPIANAGASQTVVQGDSVTLDGSASSDPDGDTLAFTWQQTGGTNVTLAGADTATATFTAPATNEVLTFSLTVDDGNGGTATDTTSVTVGTGGNTVTPTLFIANPAAVLSFQTPSVVNGNIPPNTNISGANTQLNIAWDLVVNSAGELIVSNSLGAGTARLTVYTNATTANGNLAPARNVTGAATQLTFPRGLAYSAANDTLFVANAGIPAILVFPEASTANFNGNLAPTRTFTSAGTLTSPQGIDLDANGNLYVANLATNTVLVYANAAALNGNVAPTRQITGNPAFTGLINVFVDDANDRLYAVNSAAPQRIAIFNSASTLNGPRAPDVTLTIPGVGLLGSITVDADNVGYISDRTLNRIYSYDNVSTRNGTVTPDRTIDGAATQLTNPNGLHLLE